MVELVIGVLQALSDWLHLCYSTLLKRCKYPLDTCYSVTFPELWAITHNFWLYTEIY